MRMTVLFIATVLALTACEQSVQTTRNDGADPAAIQNDAGNTYPSQAAEGSVMTTPGAEGGRSSATTGATDPGAANTAGGDAAANTQQTP